MTMEFSVVIEQDEDGYSVAAAPALHGCHTQAKTLDVLMERVQEAIELWLEVEQPTATHCVENHIHIPYRTAIPSEPTYTVSVLLVSKSRGISI